MKKQIQFKTVQITYDFSKVPNGAHWKGKVCGEPAEGIIVISDDKKHLTFYNNTGSKGQLSEILKYKYYWASNIEYLNGDVSNVEVDEIWIEDLYIGNGELKVEFSHTFSKAFKVGCKMITFEELNKVFKEAKNWGFKEE